MTMEIPFRSLLDPFARQAQRRTSSMTATALNRMTKILMTNAYNTLRAHHRVARALTPRQFEVEFWKPPGSVITKPFLLVAERFSKRASNQGFHAHGRSPDARQCPATALLSSRRIGRGRAFAVSLAGLRAWLPAARRVS